MNRNWRTACAELAADARQEKLSANLLANLAGANLTGANLTGANLTGQFSVTRTVNITVTEEEVEYRPLPSLPVRVIGRQAAINTISKRLMESPGRLLTLLGSPGVGKTTLAIAVAALVQPFFHEGVAFVELATVNDPTQLAATLANTLGLSDSSNKPAQSQLVEFLRRKSILLVLDNCE